MNSRPVAFVRVDRTWKTGDTLAIQLPLDVSITVWQASQNSVSVNHGPLTFSVKIAEKYLPWQPERFQPPWPAWEIMPASPWNYALDFHPARLADSFRVVTKAWPADHLAFTHEGTPVAILAKARKLPNWKEDHLGLVDKLQPSPVKTTVRLPKSWRVLCLAGKDWKEVAKPSGYGIEPDTFNKVSFQPVKTTALRLEVQTQNEPGRFAMGILEWSIPGAPLPGPAKK